MWGNNQPATLTMAIKLSLHHQHNFIEWMFLALMVANFMKSSTTCLPCLFPPITQSHQEFSSPGSCLEWRFCVGLCGESQRLFVFALHFWFYLHSQIQLRSSCCWLRSSPLDLVSLQNKFLVISFGLSFYSSGSSWLKSNFFPYKNLDLCGWRLCAFLSRCDLQNIWVSLSHWSLHVTDSFFMAFLEESFLFKVLPWICCHLFLSGLDKSSSVL